MLYKTKWYFLPCYYHYLTYTTPYTDVEFLQHMDITSTINHFLFSMCHKFMVDLMHSFISFFFSQNFTNIHTDILFVISFLSTPFIKVIHQNKIIYWYSQLSVQMVIYYTISHDEILAYNFPLQNLVRVTD